jgi:hypothetical protein
MRISEEKVNLLLDDMRLRAPEIEIIYKDEPLPNVWYLKFIFGLVNLVGIFSKSFKDKWMSSYANGIGRFIIFPTRKDFSDFTEYRTYALLRHEYVHVLDMKKNPLWFILTYVLLPLPLLVSGRAYWELRGYVQNMLVMYEERGILPDTYIKQLSRPFYGGMYFFMFPFKSLVLKRLFRLKEDIESGKVQGYYPPISLF